MKQILLVEDEAAHAELIHRGLARSAEPFNVTTVRTLNEARDHLSRQKPELALVDYRLPDGQGDALVQLSAGLFPVVLLTAYGSERAAVQAIQSGALDYVVKSPETFADMEHVVSRALRAWEHQAERRKAERRLESINQCLLNLGPDFRLNAEQLVSLLGRELDAHLVLYNRLAGDQMQAVAHWQKPPEFPLTFQAEGSMCYEVVRQDAPASLCIPDLFETRFAKEVPLLRRLSLRAYAGHVVHCEGKPVGSLCALFNRVHHPSEVDLRLLAILALALGSEESRCQAEKRLRESEQQYRDLFELAPSNIVVLDATGRVRDVNPAFCRRMGFQRAELIGQSITTLSRETAEAVNTNVRRILAGETLEHVVTNVRKDGSRRHYELRETAITLPDGSPGILAVSNDITERKHAEEALECLAAGTATHTSECFFELLVRNLAAALGVKFAFVGALMDESRNRIRTLSFWAGDHSLANIEYELSGTPCENVVGQKLMTYPDKVAELFPEDQLLTQLQARGYMGVPLFDNQHQPLGILAVFDDRPLQVMPKAESILNLFATRAGAELQRKRAEKEQLEMERRLLHAQKLESLGVLAGGIAHDFNNLLTAILGNLEIAQMDIDEASPAQNSLREVAAATRRAADLTRQMLAYSGRGRFVIKALDLSELVEEMAQLLKVSIAKTATLQLHLDRKLPPIQADSAQVQQVVMNLITNASEALGDKVGSIRIETGMLECGAIYLAKSRLAEKASPGRYVYLEFTDSGCGMDETVQQRLFDPFFTTKFTGRGLGMSAVLGMVRGHNGAILVTSALGQGTTIRVLFPAPTAQFAPRETDAPSGASAVPARLAGTVLMAEDEEPVRSLLTRFLTRQGLHVLAAADGREAVNLFREHSTEVTLALLDVTMPEMDGVAALAEMRQLRPGLSAILTSGYDGQEIGRRCAEQGGAEFIQKPYRLDELLALVRRHCPDTTSAGPG